MFSSDIAKFEFYYKFNVFCGVICIDPPPSSLMLSSPSLTHSISHVFPKSYGPILLSTTFLQNCIIANSVPFFESVKLHFTSTRKSYKHSEEFFSTMNNKWSGGGGALSFVDELAEEIGGFLNRNDDAHDYRLLQSIGGTCLYSRPQSQELERWKTAIATSEAADGESKVPRKIEQLGYPPDKKDVHWPDPPLTIEACFEGRKLDTSGKPLQRLPNSDSDDSESEDVSEHSLELAHKIFFRAAFQHQHLLSMI